jgi:curved DNA-binding protein
VFEEGAVEKNPLEDAYWYTPLRLKKLGMPVYGKKDEFGDLYVKINVVLPKNLSPQEKELFKKLSDMRK